MDEKLLRERIAGLEAGLQKGTEQLQQKQAEFEDLKFDLLRVEGALMEKKKDLDELLKASAKDVTPEQLNAMIEEGAKN